MNILIVDDSLERVVGFMKYFGVVGDNVSHAKDYEQAVRMLGTVQVDILFLDLGEGKTGYDLATWLEEQEAQGNINLPGKIYIHSMNPIGAKNIQRVFPQAILCPGCWLEPGESNGTGE